jgi:aminoglycoside 3-N-acetyltransferase
MAEPAVIPYTRRQLAGAFASLGVRPGAALMLHTSVRAVGPVMGGPNTIIQALLDALTPQGTLLMYVGWQDIPDYTHELSEAERAVYLAEHPPFDPATSRAVRENSILAEFLRTWPGAVRSRNPEMSVAAVGAQAELVTADHPLNYGYGAGSPLEKLITLDGQVLMLGAPLDTLTLLHYAENRARMRHKRVIHYQVPIVQNGQTVWIDIEDFDTGETHGDYSFEGIAKAYLATGGGRIGKVGDAQSYLFSAPDLTAFAIAWLEAHFG